LAEPSLPSTDEAFDPHAIAALTGGRIDMNERLLDQLIDSIRQDRAELNAVSSRGQLKDIGHKVRGAANIICATAVIEQCEALESACDANASQDIICARQSSLDTAMGTLEQALLAFRAKPPASQTEAGG
jgi:two-component system sensor histidine kinase EvgS